MSNTSFSEEYTKEILRHVAINLKLISWKYDLQHFENIGQNYFGVIIPVTISGTDNNNTSCNFQVVLKLAPTDERFRVSGAVTLFFRTEVFVYTELLKIYKIMQKEVSMPRFYMPALYFAQDEYCKEVIAMRDMREAGFKPYTHKTFLDLNHVALALESLARFHALSFVLKQQDHEIYEKVAKVCVPLTEKSNKRFIDIMIDRLTKASSKFKGTEYQRLLDNFKVNCGKLFDVAVTMAKGTCICHGDIWKENILFMYEDDEPKQTCIIDYQTTRISSPAFDTLFLIISSTDVELRSKNYHNLLDIYYKSFQQSLEAFNLEAATVYSRESLDHDLRVVAPACLITANTALWLSNGLQEEGHVKSKRIWETEEEKSKAINTYRNVVKYIIDDFYSYGYLPQELL